MNGIEQPLSWRRRLLGVMLVNLATMTWAGNAVVGRWIRDDVGPLTITALRFSVATSLLMLLLRGKPVEERRLGGDRWLLMGMGLTGVLGFSPLLYQGLHYSTAVNSSLIQGFSPLITALLAGLLIREPVTRGQFGGAVLGLFGVVGLISGGSLAFLGGLDFNLGDLMFVAAAVAWAFYSVFGRRVMGHRSAISTTAMSGLISLPPLLLAAAVEWSYVPFQARPGTLAALAYICLVPTIVGYSCWNGAVQILGAGGAMVFYNTLPLYGALLGAALLHEDLGSTHLLFGGLILLGGLWGSWGGMRQVVGKGGS